MNKNDKMRIPGFTAEASLYETSGRYQMFGTVVALSSNNRQARVEPMRRATGCDLNLWACLNGDPYGCIGWATEC